MTISRLISIGSALVCAAMLTLCLAAGCSGGEEVEFVLSCKSLIKKTKYPTDKTLKVVVLTKETGDRLEGTLDKDYEFAGKVPAPTLVRKTLHYNIKVFDGDRAVLGGDVESSYQEGSGKLESIVAMFDVIGPGICLLSLQRRSKPKE